MTVADSSKCGAYYFREKRGVIDYAFANYDFSKAKGYVISLADKASKTKTQKRIKSELEGCTTSRTILNIVDRVIRNGEQTPFIDYD